MYHATHHYTRMSLTFSFYIIAKARKQQVFRWHLLFESIRQFVYLSICQFLCLSVSQSVSQSVCLSVCLSLCLSVCLSICLLPVFVCFVFASGCLL